MSVRSLIVTLLLAAGVIAVVYWPAADGERAFPALGLPTLAQASNERVTLGRQLFVDARLSADGKMSCATCHVPAEGFTQTDRATPLGSDGQPLRRNAPTLLNVGYARPLMHDGAAPSLESQILTPLLAPNEMANADFEALERRVAAVPGYAAAFQRIFDGAPSMARVGQVLADYERSLVAGDSAFDRWRFRGLPDALPDPAHRGYTLFTGKAGCVSCHAMDVTTALFTDNLMHNTGVINTSVAGPESRVTREPSATVNFAAAGDRGRHEVTQLAGDLYRFRTPTLRNVALTAPYMHDGSLKSLEDVVRFYNAGGGANANLDPAVRALGLNDQEVADLVAFLNSLTGSNVSDLAAEAEAAAKSLP